MDPTCILLILYSAALIGVTWFWRKDTKSQKPQEKPKPEEHIPTCYKRFGFGDTWPKGTKCKWGGCDRYARWDSASMGPVCNIHHDRLLGLE